MGPKVRGGGALYDDLTHIQEFGHELAVLSNLLHAQPHPWYTKWYVNPFTVFLLMQFILLAF